MTRNGSTRQWRTLRDSIRRRHAPCALCGQPIDYTAPSPHPLSFEVDHIIPVSHAPELQYVRSNLQPAHRGCNRSKSNGQPDNVATRRNSEAW